MAEELQSLLDRINEEGVKKAEAQADEIIAAAEARARSIRTQAEADAAEMVKKGREEAEGLEKRAEAAVRQAARDIILQLQQELQTRMMRAVGTASEQALTPAFMADIIKQLAAGFAADPNARVSVLAAVKDTAALETALRDALAASFRSQPQVFGDAGIKGGMEVGFNEGQVYFDFTSDAVTALVGEYVGPRLAALLAGE